jgi:nucleoside-diphosphate-sugar epimerase
MQRDWRMMKILVAGATGAIGRMLLPLLATAGHEVIALSRRPPDALPAGTNVRVADVFDRETLARVLSEVRPDAVIHQLTDLRARDLSANSRLRTLGTRNLVDAATAAGVDLFVAQSIAWAYVPGVNVATEQTVLDVDAEPPRRTTIDGIVALERAASDVRRHVILRYGTLYGPGTWYARDGAVAQQARSGELIATGAVTNFVHVTDAAEASVQALGWPNGPVNIVDDEPARATDWMPVFAEELGAPAPRLSDSGPAVATRAVSNRRARELGWNPQHATWRRGFFA